MPSVFMTLDIDWCPDFVLDYVADNLVRKGIKATWFITHSSPAVDRLRKHADLFELALHPNFLPNSTHGKLPSEILQHCIDLVPEAVGVRTHSLVQSTPLLELFLKESRLKYDSSLILFRVSGLRPFAHRWAGRDLVRIPIFWEDDYEMELEHPVWDLTSQLGEANGYKILNFHPIHIYLNSPGKQQYESLKRVSPSLREATRQHVDPCRHSGDGTGTLFQSTCDFLRLNGSSRLKDIKQ